MPSHTLKHENFAKTIFSKDFQQNKRKLGRFSVLAKSRVPSAGPYRVALLRSPCWAGGDPGGRFGTLAAEVSQKRRRYACRYLGRAIWSGNLYGFTHFYVPNFPINQF